MFAFVMLKTSLASWLNHWTVYDVISSRDAQPNPKGAAHPMMLPWRQDNAIASIASYIRILVAILLFSYLHACCPQSPCVVHQSQQSLTTRVPEYHREFSPTYEEFGCILWPSEDWCMVHWQKQMASFSWTNDLLVCSVELVLVLYCIVLFCFVLL